MQKYISKDNNNEYSDIVKFTNQSNEFTGNFKIVENGTEKDFKTYVDNEISKSSATFKGTFDSVGELPTENVDKNDYAFVKNSDEINKDKITYTRYVFDGDKWVEEYTLNTTAFDDNQWDAINSGITETDVSTIRSIKAAAAMAYETMIADDDSKIKTISDLMSMMKTFFESIKD